MSSFQLPSKAIGASWSSFSATGANATASSSPILSIVSALSSSSSQVSKLRSRAQLFELFWFDGKRSLCKGFRTCRGLKWLYIYKIFCFSRPLSVLRQGKVLTASTGRSAQNWRETLKCLVLPTRIGHKSRILIALSLALLFSEIRIFRYWEKWKDRPKSIWLIG